MRALALLITLFLSTQVMAAKHCGVVSQGCSSGQATATIDGMTVTRPCWANTTRYACIDDAVADTCGPAIAKGCTVSSTVCQEGATINGIFQCITQQREYTCKVANAGSSTVVNCAGQQFCIEGNCFDTGAAPDPDFAKAVTGMEVAREAGVYIDETSFQVFKGQDNRCSKSVLKNCCKGTSQPAKGLTNLAIFGGSAYALDVLSSGGMKTTLVAGSDPALLALTISYMVVQEMLQCEKEEVLVALRRDNHLCHYVGDYCSKKVNLVFASICVQHKETYCCFNSKISKIVNEAARAQLPGLGWGSPTAPSCGGISLEQFQAVDLSSANFSDFYSDITPKAPNESEIQRRAGEKVNSYFGH